MRLTSLQPWMRVKVIPSSAITTHLVFCSAALALCEFQLQPALLSDAGTFEHKKFFKSCGLHDKSADDIKKAFAIIDQDKSGFIEEDELK